MLTLLGTFIPDNKLPSQLLTSLSCTLLSLAPLALHAVIPATLSSQSEGSTSEILSALNLCLASTVISITTVLNFSLAAALAVILGLTLTLASPSRLIRCGTRKILRVHCPGIYLGLDAGRDEGCDMELGDLGGVVCSVRVHGVYAPTSTGWYRVLASGVMHGARSNVRRYESDV